MKIRSLFAGLIMAAALFTGCEQEEQLGMPDVTLGAAGLEFTQDAGSQEMTFTATREWKAVYDADWIAVTPETGKGSNAEQTVTVTVTENTKGNRSAKVTITIGMVEKAFTVNQAGPDGDTGGSDEPVDAVYFNDYDKVEATKTYGSGESWPYLDQFDGWMNQQGSGVSAVTYSFSGMSARANSTSDSDYSDYAGSGMNNMFFGKDAYLATNKIALGGKTDFALSFGTEKYDGNDKTAKFDPAEFHVYLSNDGKKWVELSYTFAGTEAGRWNVASADFSVPAGTADLYICMKADKASVYRMDDLRLVEADKAGTAVDFNAGVDMDFGAGSGDGGNDDTGDTGDKPASLTKVTIAEFKTKEVNETDWYELTGKITEIQKEDWGNFVIEDETGNVLIYGMTSKWVGSNDKSFSQIGLKVGDTVTLGTLRSEYKGTPQGGGSNIPAYYISHVAGEGGDDSGNDDGGDDSGDDNTGEAGEYEPQGITWTLGEKAYDKTSGNNAQTGTVNGVEVTDMLKLGTGSLTGDATLHVPAGTKKVGFYLVAWKGKTANVKFTVAGKEITSITPNANVGATGNPPYTITLSSDDWYEIEVDASAAVDMKVETTDKANGRVIFIGLKAITE